MTFNEWFMSLSINRQMVLRGDMWMLASAAFEAGLSEGNRLKQHTSNDVKGEE